MAEKGFGVKEVNLIGPSGTPTITSPNNLNLNAVNVAISTNVSIGGTLSVTGNVSIGGTLTYEDVTNIDSVGLITARNGIKINVSPAITIRDGTTEKGYIGFNANDPFIGRKNGVGIAFQNNKIRPVDGDDGSGSDNTVDIGENTYKFKDAYFSGTVTATTFSGSGASLTSIPAGQLTGTVADARISTLTASKLSGALPAISGANLTNLPTTDPSNSDIQVVYTVTANGSSAYRFAGNGVVSTADNPNLYLIRGQKYRFINNSGGSHPFQIRESSGGTAYSTGVTNNGASSGNIDFAPTFDSPSKLVYQCTSHGGMVGNIYMTGGVGRWIQQSIVTLQSGSSYEFTGIPSDVNEVMIVFDGLSFDSNGNEIEFVLGNSGGYVTSGYIISASYEPGGNYQKRTTSIRFNGIGSSSYFPTGRLHLWKPVHSNNWWAEGICYPWETEGQYQHRVTGTAPSGGTLSKIKIQGSAGANFDNTGNGKIQLSYIRY